MHFLGYGIWYDHINTQWEILDYTKHHNDPARVVLRIKNRAPLLKWLRKLGKRGVNY